MDLVDELTARLTRLAVVAAEQEERRARAAAARYLRDHPISREVDLPDTPPPGFDEDFWRVVAECTRRRLRERFPELG